VLRTGACVAAFRIPHAKIPFNEAVATRSRCENSLALVNFSLKSGKLEPAHPKNEYIYFMFEQAFG